MIVENIVKNIVPTVIQGGWEKKKAALAALGA